jgi:hypothetical protein
MVDMSKSADCGEKFLNDTSLEWHKKKSAACRLSEKGNKQNLGANPCPPTSPTRSG